MILPVHAISDAVIGEPWLPDLAIPLKFSLSSEGKSTFDQLNWFFDGLKWSNQRMKMIGRDHICMKVISPAVVMLNDISNQFGPSLDIKEISPTISLSRNKIGILATPNFSSHWPHLFASGAKAPIYYRS